MLIESDCFGFYHLLLSDGLTVYSSHFTRREAILAAHLHGEEVLDG